MEMTGSDQKVSATCPPEVTLDAAVHPAHSQLHSYSSTLLLSLLLDFEDSDDDS